MSGMIATSDPNDRLLRLTGAVLLVGKIENRPPSSGMDQGLARANPSTVPA